MIGLYLTTPPAFELKGADFYVLPTTACQPHTAKTLKECKLPVWLDLAESSVTQLKWILDNIELQFEGLLIPFHVHPETYVREVLRWRDFKIKNELKLKFAAIWESPPYLLDFLLESDVEDIYLPEWITSRTNFIRRFQMTDNALRVPINFYGFNTVDELRRHKVNKLITFEPMAAALRGIELAARERRPKQLRLPRWNHAVSSAQFDLAQRNLDMIREALYEGRNNRSTP